MSLSLLTFYMDNYVELTRLVIPNRDEYCARHGYTHVVKTGPYKDAGLYYAVQRLWFLLDEMEKPGASEYWWVMNAQSVITNMTKDVMIVTDPNHHFWIARDINGLNAGVFVVKNSERGRAWIRFVAEKAPHINHCWHEQRVMQENETNIAWADVVSVIHPSLCNSYRYSLYNWPDTTPGDWRPGDLVLSFPGTSLSERLSLVPDALKLVTR